MTKPKRLIGTQLRRLIRRSSPASSFMDLVITMRILLIRNLLRMREIMSLVRTGNLTISLLGPFSALRGEMILSLAGQPKKGFRVSRQILAPERIELLSCAPLRAYRVGNVLAELNYEVVFQEGKPYRQPLHAKLGFPSEPEDLFRKSQLGVWNSKHYAIHRNVHNWKNPVIPRGILLNGQFADNWYHWTINILPKLFLLEEYGGISTSIPAVVSARNKRGQFSEMLALIASPDREIVFVPDGAHLVEDAIVIDSPTREAYLPSNVVRPIRWAHLGSFHFEVMKAYREKLLEVARTPLSSEGSNSPEYVFFKRTSLRRVYNQDEVESVLLEYGFTGLVFQDLSVSDQIRVMGNAKVFVGPTGSEWANFLFSSFARGLILLPEFLGGSTLFSKLGALGNSELFEHFVATSARSWKEYSSSNSASFVDIGRLRKDVESILDGA